MSKLFSSTHCGVFRGRNRLS